jgi:hypothetical protein
VRLAGEFIEHDVADFSCYVRSSSRNGDFVSTPPAPPRATLSAEEAWRLITALQSELVGVKSELGAKMASLEETIANLAQENLLLKRRLFGNKTERSHTSEAQLALGDLLAAESRLQKELDAAVAKAKEEAGAEPKGPGAPGERAKPKGATCLRATCRAAWWRSSTRSWKPRGAGASVSRRASS